MPYVKLDKPVWPIYLAFLLFGIFFEYKLINWYWEKKCTVSEAKIEQLQHELDEIDGDLSSEIETLNNLKKSSDQEADRLKELYNHVYMKNYSLQGQIDYLENNSSIKPIVVEKKVYIKPDECVFLPQTQHARDTYNETANHFNKFISD